MALGALAHAEGNADVRLGTQSLSAPASPTSQHDIGLTLPQSPGTPGTRESPFFGLNSPPDAQHQFAAELEQQFFDDFERATQRKQADETAGRFSLSDIVSNPRLSHAAWRELEGRRSRTPDSPPEPAGLHAPASLPRVRTASAAAPRQHSNLHEMTHYLRTGAAMQADTMAESRINAEMAELLLARLTAGRSALEEAYRFVQALQAAEAQMAAALFATRGAALGCESDGAVLHRVHATVTVVPASLAGSHVRQSVALRNLALNLSDAARMYANSQATLKRSIAAVRDMMDLAGRRVGHALQAHEAACAEAETISLQQKQRADALWQPAVDPWASQAVLAAAQHRLCTSQQAERGLVIKGHDQVERLECHRMTCWQCVVSTLVEQYGAHGSSHSGRLDSAQDDATPLQQLQELLSTVQWDLPLRPVREASKLARQTAQHMHAQAEEAATTVSRGLFASLTIAKQGPLDRWDAASRSWHRCHCVLTRSGFLHTCRGVAGAQCEPAESLTLRRFEARAAPQSSGTFHLARRRHVWFGGAREPKRAFRAADAAAAAAWLAALQQQAQRWRGPPDVHSVLLALTPR